MQTLIEDQEEEVPYLCSYCNAPQPEGFRFCSACGVKNSLLTKKEEKDRENHDRNIKFLFTYTLLIIVSLVLSSLLDDSYSIIWSLTIAFALIDLVFAFLQPGVFRLFKIDTPSLGWFALIILGFVVSGIVVHIVVEKLNSAMEVFSLDSSWYFLGAEYPLFESLLVMALFPAVFEELAFRGFLYNNLNELGGAKAAVWGSAFLFAIVHFSLLSLFWLLPFGYILAIMRKKSGTLWYGILAHFIHNSTVTIIEYYDIMPFD